MMHWAVARNLTPALCGFPRPRRAPRFKLNLCTTYVAWRPALSAEKRVAFEGHRVPPRVHYTTRRPRGILG